MFEEVHKGHSFLNWQDSLKQLRGLLYGEFEKGRLKVETTENALLDIRQAQLTCDQMKSKLMNTINDSFAKLIKSLKQRKKELVEEIDNYFASEKSKIAEHESNWKHKQQLTQELLQLNSTSTSDVELLQKGKFIATSIENINQPIKFQEMKLINSLNDHLVVPAHDVKFVEEKEPEKKDQKSDKVKLDEDEQKPKDVDITLHQLLVIIKGYMSISEYKAMQYKA